MIKIAKDVTKRTLGIKRHKLRQTQSLIGVKAFRDQSIKPVYL